MTDRTAGTGDGDVGRSGGRARGSWRDVTGLIVLDKPTGITSNGALQRVRRIFRARKAGHTGSLDPEASGVLPICFGEATKLSGYLLDAQKTYEVVGCLGTRTSTGDATGEVIAQSARRQVDAAALERTLTRFRGEIEQIPPMYSALKHRGQRLYRLARQGQTVERDPRKVTIRELELLSIDEDKIALRVTCSKGTYIRTLIEDIGTALGSEAHVIGLRRTASGPFRIELAVTLDHLASQAEEGMDTLYGLLLPADSAVEAFPAVRLSDDQAGRLMKGQAVIVEADSAAGLVRLYDPKGVFLGLGTRDAAGRVAPKRLFRT